MEFWLDVSTSGYGFREPQPLLHAAIAGDHSSYSKGPTRLSSAQSASPRPHHAAGDPGPQGGFGELRRSRLESTSLSCASRCAWWSCRAAVSPPGSPGLSPLRPAPLGSLQSAAEQPPSPAAASPSESGPVRTEAWRPRNSPRLRAVFMPLLQVSLQPCCNMRDDEGLSRWRIYYAPVLTTAWIIIIIKN